MDPFPDYSDVVSATGFLPPRASRSLATFREHFETAHRVLALLGAGLSAASGLPTFRGAGGLWQTHDVKQLSTPTAFEHDPVLVWTFYLERWRAARDAKPNAAHFAISALAKTMKGFLALNMNIDGLCDKAGHPPSQIFNLHGNLADVKCSACTYRLDVAAAEQILHKLDGLTDLSLADIPRCEGCHVGLVRPGVVWFQESLDKDMLRDVYTWIEAEPMIDTMLVIGTSAEVYPATAYIEGARRKGARVAVVNTEQEDPALLGLKEHDWYFQGDAAIIVPQMLDTSL